MRFGIPHTVITVWYVFLVLYTARQAYLFYSPKKDVRGRKKERLLPLNIALSVWLGVRLLDMDASWLYSDAVWMTLVYPGLALVIQIMFTFGMNYMDVLASAHNLSHSRLLSYSDRILLLSGSVGFATALFGISIAVTGKYFYVGLVVLIYVLQGNLFYLYFVAVAYQVTKLLREMEMQVSSASLQAGLGIKRVVRDLWILVGTTGLLVVGYDSRRVQVIARITDMETDYNREDELPFFSICLTLGALTVSSCYADWDSRRFASCNTCKRSNTSNIQLASSSESTLSVA